MTKDEIINCILNYQMLDDKFDEMKIIEDVIAQLVKEVINDIIENNNVVDIVSKSRSGAEISNWLENKFVDYFINNKNSFILNVEASPKGKTKNPWDVRFYFCIPDLINEEVWVDFKCFKNTQNNSNPDVGSPNKFIQFVKRGGFYILFVYLWYIQYNKNKIMFLKKNNSYCKVFFLKDINKGFRRNPKNQLQVGASLEPEYRTKIEFMIELKNKMKESYERQIQLAYKGLVQLNMFDEYIEQIKKSNKCITSKIKEFKNKFLNEKTDDKKMK